MDFNVILGKYEKLRDHIKNQTHGEHDIFGESEIAIFVIGKLFSNLFNTYVSIGILLREKYYEQASILLRNMWETKLNLLWIMKEPRERADLFAGYTFVEWVKIENNEIEKLEFNQKHELANHKKRDLKEFEKSYSTQLKRYTDRSGRYWDRFVSLKPKEIAKTLSNELLNEYHTLYKLTCMYTHSSPGTVMFPAGDAETIKREDLNRSVITAVFAITIMIQIYKLYCESIHLDDSQYLIQFEREVPTLF